MFLSQSYIGEELSDTGIARESARYPAGFVREFAKACLDAGADVFLGHGPHVLQGIEIHNRKPIFYSLGNFIVQNLTVKKVSFDQYRLFDLDYSAKPSDFFAARSGQIPPSGMPYAEWWFESIIPVIQLDTNGETQIALYPIAIDSPGANSFPKGSPHLASPRQAEGIIEHLRDISKEWDTAIIFDNGIGRISC